MGFPKEFVEQVKTASDIVQVVQSHVALRKAGRDFTGLCPFHGERTASFSVSPSKGFYYCYGCKATGDVFGFVQEIEKISFIEAVERLAARAGLRAPERRTTPEDRAKQSLLDACEFAADWFARQLTSDPAEPARAYLTRRKVSPESVKRFRIGYAPSDWDSLLKAAKSQGMDGDLMVRAGLAARSEKTGKVFDFFRGRVLFPISDHRGRVISFGGRILEGQGPSNEAKYINTRETPLFVKGRTIYGLHHAGPAIKSAGEAVLLEGYLDVVASHQHGLVNAVAPLGTALTGDHLAVIRKYGERAVLVFDGDAAGDSAAQRVVELCIGDDIRVKVVALPRGDDPDTYLHREGPTAFRKLVDRAKPALEFRAEVAIGRGELETPAGKAAIVRELLPALAAIRGEVECQQELHRLSDRLGVAEAALMAELAAFRKTGAAPPVPQVRRTERPSLETLARSGADRARDAAEHLLKLMLEDASVVGQVRAQLGAESFGDPEQRELAGLLLGLPDDAAGVPQAAVLSNAGEEARHWMVPLVARIAMGKAEYVDRARGAEALIRLLIQERKRARLLEIEPRVKEMIDQRAERDEALFQEFLQLQRDVRGGLMVPTADMSVPAEVTE